MDTFGDLLSDLQSMLLISLSNNANFVELTPTAVNEESAIKYMKNINAYIERQLTCPAKVETNVQSERKDPTRKFWDFKMFRPG